MKVLRSSSAGSPIHLGLPSPGAGYGIPVNQEEAAFEDSEDEEEGGEKEALASCTFTPITIGVSGHPSLSQQPPIISTPAGDPDRSAPRLLSHESRPPSPPRRLFSLPWYLSIGLVPSPPRRPMAPLGSRRERTSFPISSLAVRLIPRAVGNWALGSGSREAS